MTEQQQHDTVLDEAVRVMDGLRRRVVRGAIRGAVSGPRDTGDVWSKATRDEPFDHIATGSAECRMCPICRAIAAARTSGPDVVDYMVDAGESLMSAAREAMAAYERSRRTGRDAAAGSDAVSPWEAASAREETGGHDATGGRSSAPVDIG